MPAYANIYYWFYVKHFKCTCIMMNSFRNLRKISSIYEFRFDIVFIIAANLLFLVPYPISFIGPESNRYAARLNNDVYYILKNQSEYISNDLRNQRRNFLRRIFGRNHDSHWAGLDLYRAPPTFTRVLGFGGLLKNGLNLFSFILLIDDYT